MRRSAQRCPLERSSTLLVTLFFIGLISILVVGFLSNMEAELGASHSHLDGVLADVYAQAGLDTGLTKLSSALQSTNTIWLSGPGRLTTFSTTVSSTVHGVSFNTITNSNTVELSSGPQPANADANEAADLNPSQLTNVGTGILAATNGPMRVSWVYVLKQGEMSTNLPSYDPQNPVVGRFAYWVDDEGAKINLNTAAQRGTSATNIVSYPTNVDLTVLPGMEPAQVNALISSRATNFFNTPAEAARIPGMQAIVATNLFSLTTYNHAQQLNMFGEPRIVLTTQLNLTNGVSPVFLDILKTENTDPGYLANLDPNKTYNTIGILTNELNRVWPFTTNTFAQKYPNDKGTTTATSSDLAQVAIDIIDYVRSVESTNEAIEPLRFNDTGTPPVVNFAVPTAAWEGGRMGWGRRPYVTEIGAVFLGKNATKTTTALTPPGNPPYPEYSIGAPAKGKSWYYVLIQFSVKFYLPPMTPACQGWAGISDLNKYYFDLGITAPTTLISGGHGPLIQTTDFVGKSILAPGHYVTINRTNCLYSSNTFTVSPALLATADIQPDLSIHGTGIDPSDPVTELAPAAKSIVPTYMGFSVATAGTPITGEKTLQVNDPIVNHEPGDFYPVGTSTLGVDGNSKAYTVGTPPSQASLYQDTDSGGKIAQGYCLPAPKGQTGNLLGIVRSVGELGYIPTGIRSVALPTASGNARFTSPGIPWRTIRLQPQTTGSKYIPDWAMLDLFAVPLNPNNTTASTMVEVTNETIGGNTIPVIGGRVNVNGDLALTNSDGQSMGRPLPLAAILQGATNSVQILGPSSTVGSTNNSTTSLALASNIANHVLAANGIAYTNGSNNLYYSPGQLAEIKGVADGGEASEELLRDILPLATARGDVFTIYSVGQSLLQDQSGALHIQGERRVAQTVERFLSNGKNQFRPIDTRTLSP